MKNIILILFIFAVSAFFSQNLSASCIGSIPVFGTGSTKEDCKKKSQSPAEISPEEDDEIDNEIPPFYQGTGAGTHNTNVILGSQPFVNQSSPSAESDSGLILTTHQVRIELAPYIMPGAYQFDDPGLPERVFLNGFSWEYYLNKTLGFGILYQEWSRSGGRDFKPISFRDSSGDTHDVAFPGAVQRLKYTLYIPYVTINAKLSPLWCLGGRFGIGHVGVEAEYNESQISSGNTKYSDNTSLLFDLFLERWFSGARVGTALRYISARTDTDDYLEYMNMGSAQVVLYVQFTLKPLGLL